MFGDAGLKSEADKHTTKEAPDDGDLLDIVILSQYKRMCHYGISGFTTAATYAKAIGLKEHEATLKTIVTDIYQADDYASKLAEKAEKAAAKNS